MRKSHFKKCVWIFSALLIFQGAPGLAAETKKKSGAENRLPADYKKLNSDCEICPQLDQLRQEYSLAETPEKRLDRAFAIGKHIRTLAEQKTQPKAIHTAIHYSIDACLEILPTDFDRTCIFSLIEVRKKYQSAFDPVLWRFSKTAQEQIVGIIRDIIKNGLAPGVQAPVIRVVNAD